VVAHGSAQGRHSVGLQNGYSVFDGLAHVVIDMALAMQVTDVLVVGAE
jgi:hypothetical protein